MGSRRAGRRRALISLGVVLVWFIGLVPLASAAVGGAPPIHATVLSVTPADGSRLDRAPAQIVVVFDDDVNPAFVQVTLTSGGSPVPLGAPSVSGGTVAVPVPPGSAEAAASYRIAFRVVSADGHPVSGSSEFTVTGAAAATAGAPSASATTPSSSPSGSPAPSQSAPTSDQPIAAAPISGGASGVPVAVAVAGVVVVIGGALLVRRRRRTR